MRDRVVLLCALLLCALGAQAAPGKPAPKPLATFTVQDYLRHRWQDELVHFAFDVATTAKALRLTDAAGTPVPCQFSNLTRARGRVKGTVWTVVSLEPDASATFQLHPGTSTARPGITVQRVGNRLVLQNDRLALALPQWPGTPAQPVDLTTLPGPISAVARPQGPWLGECRWINDGPALQVTDATTTILEGGPVRVTVQQRLTFTGGNSYQATIQLAARQDAALITEDSRLEAPKAGFRFSLTPGLGANRVYWRNNYFADPGKGLKPAEIPTDKEQKLLELRPWSYWWLKDLSAWIGFYQEGQESLVGVLMTRPSRWSPYTWDGFDRTAVPVMARAGGGLDLTFGLLAGLVPDGKGGKVFHPLHREWALTLGTVRDHVVPTDGQAKLRQQLIKYSEFPLDEVKEYGFAFTAANPKQTHPFLLFNQQEIDRVRAQVKMLPALQEKYAKITRYVQACGGKNLADKVQKGDWQGFYTQNYIGNALYNFLPDAYIGSDDPMYGVLLAAGVKGLAANIMQTFVEAPERPDIGCYGPWFTTNFMRLLLSYDLLADSELLTPEEHRYVRSVLVFSAHFIAHPDYWNTERGLCSANPNMTSSIYLPLGMMGLYLHGHPKAEGWLRHAEAELKSELEGWVAPGGAWIENPGYQLASMDGIFLLAQALKNVKGRDYFAHPKFKELMDYMGFILTAPDVRFPLTRTAEEPGYMTLPSIGDGFSGEISLYNGWMAQATAKSDPAYSARQQFYWAQQGYTYESAGRAHGYGMPLMDPTQPATPPSQVSQHFPAFGNVLRTSWTDPKATYVAHRAGYFVHHYHREFNSLVYYAKGAPLCIDFGNCYQPVQRWEPKYHNMVSLDLEDQKGWGMSGVEDPQALEMRSLPSVVDYSYGESKASGNQRVRRHVLLVKSADPLGANYLVVRDATQDGQPNQQFFYNLWCLAKGPAEIAGSVAHFTGQFGVDLDVHVLAPANPQFQADHWGWKQQIYVWGPFAEEQHGIHVRKAGSKEDFFTVLYPRAQGQAAAQATPLANGAAVQVEHLEGTDVVLHAPGTATTVTAGPVRLAGEVAFARQYRDGRLRLAVVKGTAMTAAVGEWTLASTGPVAVQIAGTALTGESSGPAQTVQLTLPVNFPATTVLLDGKPLAAPRDGNVLTLALPEGAHTFTITGK